MVEEQHAVEVNGQVKSNGVVTVGTLSAGYAYEHTDTTTNTTYWDETTAQHNRAESSAYYDEVRSRTVTPAGGSIKVTMGAAQRRGT